MPFSVLRDAMVASFKLVQAGRICVDMVSTNFASDSTGGDFLEMCALRDAGGTQTRLFKLVLVTPNQATLSIEF